MSRGVLIRVTIENYGTGRREISRPMKDLQSSTHLAHALLAGAEGAEVLRGLGDGLSVEAERDAARLLAADLDVEEDLCKVREQEIRSRSPYYSDRRRNRCPILAIDWPD